MKLWRWELRRARPDREAEHLARRARDLGRVSAAISALESSRGTSSAARAGATKTALHFLWAVINEKSA